MFEFLILLIIAVIMSFTLFMCFIGLLIAVVVDVISIRDRAILALFCIVISYLNFSYVSTKTKSEFIKTFEKEEVVRDFKEAEINGKKYIFNDNTSIRIDYNNYYKLLCDEYFLNVYEDRRVNQIYFYKHSTTKDELYGEVSCMGQKILKGE